MKKKKTEGDMPDFIAVLKRFINLNKESSGTFVAAVILILADSIFSILNNILLGRVVDDAAAKNFTFVLQGFVALGGLEVVRLPVSYFVNFYVSKLSETCVKRMREHTYNHISKGSIEWLDSSNTGDILSRVSSDLGALVGSISNFLSWQFSSIISLIVALTVCIALNWKLSLISFIAIPILAVLQSKTGKPIAKYTKARTESDGKAMAVFVDLLNGLTISKAFGLEKAMFSKYKVHVDNAVKNGIKNFTVEFTMLPLQMLMDFLPELVRLGAGTYFVIHHQMTLGGLLTFIFISSYVTNPIGGLAWMIRDIYETAGVASRVFHIWDMELEDEGGELTENTSECPVAFNDVEFGYKDKEKLFDNLSFEVNKGERIALVGTSGAGKSTILKLIAGFYKKNAGHIVVYGNKIEDWNTKALRSRLSYVGQDPFLFPGSIFDNTALGNRKCSTQEVLDVIKVVGLDNLDIYSEIGERGVKLSGGQRQRVSIARAILKNAPIILLDEPTSALDTESEYYVTLALEELMKDKVSIIVGHRLSAIRNVRRILTLDSGVIVEEGTHEELMNLNGVYRRLYENQAKEVLVNE